MTKYVTPSDEFFPYNAVDVSAHFDVVASECDLYGHDYAVREDDAEPREVAWPRAPVRIPGWVFCGRCGKSWKVER